MTAAAAARSRPNTVAACMRLDRLGGLSYAIECLYWEGAIRWPARATLTRHSMPRPRRLLSSVGMERGECAGFERRSGEEYGLEDEGT